MESAERREAKTVEMEMESGSPEKIGHATKEFGAESDTAAAEIDIVAEEGDAATMPEVKEGDADAATELEREEAPWVDIYCRGKSVTEMEEEEFAAYRQSWEREWGNGHGSSFQNLCT